MNIDAIIEDLNNHIEEIKKYKLKTPNVYRKIDSIWGDCHEIELCIEITNLNTISLVLKMNKHKEEFTILCTVGTRSGYYDEFKKLGSTKIYTEYSFDKILHWLKYVKEIKHIICQAEDYIQKLIGTAVRKGIIFKDDLI